MAWRMYQRGFLKSLLNLHHTVLIKFKKDKTENFSKVQRILLQLNNIISTILYKITTRILQMAKVKIRIKFTVLLKK